MSACKHDWRTGPVCGLRGQRQAVCICCFGIAELPAKESAKWPEWTEEDYWAHLDRIEGNLAPEIRRWREEGRV